MAYSIDLSGRVAFVTGLPAVWVRSLPERWRPQGAAVVWRVAGLTNSRRCAPRIDGAGAMHMSLNWTSTTQTDQVGRHIRRNGSRFD